MTTTEFIEMFQELIQTDASLDLQTPLGDIEEWDSMAMMALIAYMDVTYKKAVSFDELASLDTVGEVAALIPDFNQ